MSKSTKQFQQYNNKTIKHNNKKKLELHNLNISEKYRAF